MNEIDKIGRKLLKYPNVVGYSKHLRYRIRKGKIIKDEICLQVHVSKKLPENQLRIEDILPKAVNGIPIDVVEYGFLRALILMPTKETANIKKGIVRPIRPGISIGNYAITAGTLGNFVVKITSPDVGKLCIASNAHILTDEPSRKKPFEKTIIQPGRADGGTLRNKIGEYYWHKRIIPRSGKNSCPITNLFCKSFNTLAKILGRKSRLTLYSEATNNIDFAVASFNVHFVPEHIDKVFHPDKYKLLGYGFAGSEKVSLVCKGKYIAKEGYDPLIHDFVEAEFGQTVEKSSRNCFAKDKVIDESACELVFYGNYLALFDDIIVTNAILQGGCSGSAIYVRQT